MNYSDFENRVSILPNAHVIGHVGLPGEMFRMYKIKRGNGKKVLLLAGAHGDEEAGPLSLIEFFEHDICHYESNFEFTGFICINPWGFEHSSRTNAFKQNLNREWRRDTSAKEIRIILGHLESYEVAIDFHEVMKNWVRRGDNEPVGEDPEGFFLWETCIDHANRIGRTIVERVERAGYPVCKWPMIYGDRNSDGVISYPEDCLAPCYLEGTASDSYLIREGHAPHAFTTETVREWPMKDRIAVNFIALHTVLEEKLERS